MARGGKKQRGIFERPKGRGIWWICYFDQFGMKHREKVGMKSTAIKVYQQRKTEIRQGKFEPEEVKRKHQNATVGEIIDDCIASAKAKSLKSIDDVKQRLSWWKIRLGDRAAKSIVKKDIDDARLELAESKFPSNGQKIKTGGRSVATVNCYLATLKTAFMLAVENEKIDKNPFRKVKLSKEENERMRYLTDEEEKGLFSILPTEYHPLVVIALHTGMRKSELLRLKWEAVDFKLRIITIRKSKSGKARHIGMNTRVIETLQGLPRMINNPYVFYGKKVGEPLKNGIKHSDWVKYLQRAGIEDFHWHDLRHTFASRLVMAGVDLYKIKELMGTKASK